MLFRFCIDGGNMWQFFFETQDGVDGLLLFDPGIPSVDSSNTKR